MGDFLQVERGEERPGLRGLQEALKAFQHDIWRNKSGCFLALCWLAGWLACQLTGSLTDWLTRKERGLTGNVVYWQNRQLQRGLPDGRMLNSNFTTANNL